MRRWTQFQRGLFWNSWIKVKNNKNNPRTHLLRLISILKNSKEQGKTRSPGSPTPLWATFDSWGRRERERAGWKWAGKTESMRFRWWNCGFGHRRREEQMEAVEIWLADPGVIQRWHFQSHPSETSKGQDKELCCALPHDLSDPHPYAQ